ncbi:MAG: inositol monophosphatase family protein [Anaerolineae bacterium]
MLQLALKAAREAGSILRSHYGNKHTIHYKGLRDITTEADYLAEQTVMRIISEGCPSARFVTEESQQEHLALDDTPIWLIDPLDGTTNYARGLPEFSVSIALAQYGRVQAGVVYEPLTEQLFYAEHAQGAYLNEHKLEVSRRPLRDALVLHDWPRQPEPRAQMADLVTQIAPLVDCVRSRGSAALGFCAVAAGWAEVYFQLTLQPWDVAAGLLIVEEAGGRVSSLDGLPAQLYQPAWLATNGLVHDDIVALVRS